MSTRERLDLELVTVLYDAREIIEYVHDANMVWLDNGVTGAQTADALIDLIQQTVVPSLWEKYGGVGTIRLLGGVMVVRAPVRVHEEVRELLSGMRGMLQNE